MTISPPAWLTQRRGALKLSSDGHTWFVLLDGKPQYELVVTPTQGKFGATVKQTINGRRVISKDVFPTAEEALQGGLKDLARDLGYGE
jgi:hypothetical protein